MPDSEKSTSPASAVGAEPAGGGNIGSPASAPLEDAGGISSDRFAAIPEGRGLREHTTRGVVVNASFNIGLAWVGLLRRFLVAAFLTAAEYGLWGLLIAALSTLLFLKEVGIGDKYIQQNEVDQELAFQKAFTFEAILTFGFVGLSAAALPLFALIYDEPGMIGPGLVLLLMLPLSLLSFPRIIFYRRMQYARQRVLEAIDPIVGIIVTLGLGALGAGYWALIIGAIAGAGAAGVVTALMSPYPLRFRYERDTLREYVSFSWPLVVSQSSGLVTIQATLIAGKASVGLAGIGLIGLAGQFSGLADRVQQIISRTIYPAICAVADRMELLHESFVKSNRVGLMWAMPFSLGLTLFGGDLVELVLGDRWSDAAPLIQAFGVVVAINQVGFNWSAFMRARADTRGIGVVAVGGLIVSLTVTIPGLLVWGLDGYMWSQIIVAAALLVLRGYYLERMFQGFKIFRHLLRSVAPSVPAVAAVLAVRLAESGDRTALMAVGELGLYVLLSVAFTWLLERELLREMSGYLRRMLPARRAAVT